MQNESFGVTRPADPAVKQGKPASSTGLLALWVGTELTSAYQSLDKQAKARVRNKVKAIFRDVLHHENPDIPPSETDELAQAGIRSQARGITKTIIEVLRATKVYTSVLEITTAVQKEYPSVSAYAVRRVCNRCALAAYPIMLKSTIPNPNPVRQGNHERVDAFKLTPEMQRKRKTGNVVRDGVVIDTLRERIVQVIGRAPAPVTAADIKRALRIKTLTMDNLYSYLSILKGEGIIEVCEKKQANSRRVNAYIFPSRESLSCPPL